MPKIRKVNSRDISDGGIFFHSNCDIAIGTEVEVTFTLPSDPGTAGNKRLRVQGTVVRAERETGETGYGVAITGSELLEMDEAVAQTRQAVRRLNANAEAVLDLFHDDGIEVLLNTELLEVEGSSGHGIKLRLRNSQDERTLEGSDVLVGVGRVPNTHDLGLDKTGVETDDSGYIRVNERLQTSAPGIWAMGECAGSPKFTHVATDDFRIVRDNLNGGNRTTQGRLVPFCIFTDPELARVGLSELEAQKRTVPYRLATIPMAKVRRTVTLSETRGFLKALISAESDDILGFTAFGAEAGELMAVVQTAMLAKLPYTAIRDAILAHPTMAEGLNVLFAAVPARAAAGARQRRQREKEGEAAA